MLILAIVLNILTIAYHQLTTILDLYPFNNVRDSTPKERRKEAVTSGIIMVVPLVLLILAVFFGWRWLAYVSGGFSIFIFMGALLTWWPPYLVGKSVPWAALGEDWDELYSRTFGKTIIILPPFKGRPRPNLEHNILHLLILIAGVATIWYASLR